MSAAGKTRGGAKARSAPRRDSGSGYGALAAAGGRALAARLLLVWLTVASAVAALWAGNDAARSALSAPAGCLPFACFTVAVAMEWAVFRRRTLNADVRIVAIATFLVGLGIVLQLRMGTFSGRHAGFQAALPAGLAALPLAYATASNRRWAVLERGGLLCYAVAVALLAFMAVFGKSYRGGIYLPGNMNPSEFAKPLLVVFLAAFLGGRRKDFSAAAGGLPRPPAKALARLAVLWAVPMALVVALHDLGLLLLLNAVLAVMLYAVGRRVGYLILGALGGGGAGVLLWFVSAHVRARLAAWLNPFADPTGSGWQLLQGFSAMFAGGLWGAGIGAGEPQAVPIATMDFIYAAMAEEFGAVLCALVLALYAALLCRGFLSAGRAKTPFGELLAVGLAAALAGQAILNIGGVTKALPLTGIVLPFLSQGGSGLVAMLAMTGLLVAVGSSE